MRAYDIIKKKRDGGKLSKQEIEFFVNGYVKGDIPDYQAAAFLMAVYFSKLDMDETLALTFAIRDSGDKVDLSQIDGVLVDKHSTGGVGDKTTLVIAPVMAALGYKIAKMSGRGLGHTGGTIDKLESIKGFNTVLSKERFIDVVNQTGLAVIAQSGNLTPADKKLYALRDVTATVDNISLIVSSIMGKKLALGSDCLLLDVKVGSGAFMKTLKDAKELATQMVSIGKAAGKKTVAFITNMDSPLGNAVGNSIEVIEAIETLKGNGPTDLTELCKKMAVYLLKANGESGDLEKRVEDVFANGKALQKFTEMVKAQGGDENEIKNPELFPKAKYSKDILAEKSGYIVKMDTEKIGTVALILGAGRAKKEDEIDFSAGVYFYKKIDKINEGERIATLYTNQENTLETAEKAFREALTVADKPIEQLPIILEIVD